MSAVEGSAAAISAVSAQAGINDLSLKQSLICFCAFFLNFLVNP